MASGGAMKIKLRPLYKTILTYIILAVELFAPLYCNCDSFALYSPIAAS